MSDLIKGSPLPVPEVESESSDDVIIDSSSSSSEEESGGNKDEENVTIAFEGHSEIAQLKVCIFH